MSKWELEKSADGDPADKLLADGWEPFAIEPETEERYSAIWFKRLKQPENCPGCESSHVGHAPGCRGKESRNEQKGGCYLHAVLDAACDLCVTKLQVEAGDFRKVTQDDKEVK